MNQQVRRRSPIQGRASQTRTLILEAAARMLESQGLDGFNTNRLAEASGFSVGTIYQYFANKQEILQALGGHERERRVQQIRKTLATRVAGVGEPASPERIRAVVRTILEAYGSRHRARRILVELALQSGRLDDLQRPVNALADLLVPGGLGEGGGKAVLSDADAFVLTHAVAGVVRAALAQDTRLLGQREFEDALVAMVDGFLRTRLRSGP